MGYKFGIPELDSISKEVEDGSNILIRGPAMAGKSSFLQRVVAEGIENDEGIIYVTTNHSGNDILNEYSDYDINKDRFRIVDCVSERQGIGDMEETDIISMTSSPDDMTGIGIKVSEIIEDLWELKSVEKNRVVLNSVSTLLMYSELQTVFRFLHVFTGRIRSVDGLGIFTVDSEMHSEKEFSTLNQLFDGIVEVRKEGDGAGQVRLSGRTNEDSDWINID